MTKGSLIVIASVAFVVNFGSVGYLLFLWGSEGLAFSTSLWIAFKTWIFMIITGVMVFISIYYLNKLKKNKL